MFGGYVFYWGRVWQARWDLLAGTLTTVEVAVISIALAFVLGVAGGLARRSSNRALARAATVYVEAMRNSPSLVKMYFIYFGLPTIGLYPGPFTSGVVALVLHNGAYMTEIFRGGLAAVPETEIQAARSLGMGPVLIFRTIVFPQALRRALPAFGNNWTEIVKDTSITSALSVRELFFMVTTLVSETMRSFELLMVASAVYLILTTALAGALKVVERRARYLV
jgi:His/Glu/Gln/Arg/opine family amino acid ABC transporter permease subunit